jgi:hypothetical protein
MRASLALASSLVALAAATVALADTTKVEDNRNARANMFDIEAANAGHKGALLRHTIRTYHRWGSSELRSTSARPRMIAIYVWEGSHEFGTKQDFQLFVRFRKGKLRGYVLRVRPREKMVGTFKVRRLDRRSITFDFDPALIDDPDSYRWQAVSGFTGKGCPKVPRFQFGCDDSAPTGNAQLHDLTAR